DGAVVGLLPRGPGRRGRGRVGDRALRVARVGGERPADRKLVHLQLPVEAGQVQPGGLAVGRGHAVAVDEDDAAGGGALRRAGRDVVVAHVDIAATGLPQGHGTPAALHTLAETAVRMSWLQALVAVFPASLYGEGLRRAFDQLSPVTEDRFTGWRGRLGLLPL